MKNLKQNNIPFLGKISKLLLVISMTLLLVFISCSKDDDNPIDPVLTPSLTNISPISGPKTTIVTINGNDFGTNTNTTKVFFNDVEATVQNVSNTQITAVVPPRAFTGVVKVISNGTTPTGSEFTYTISDIQVAAFVGGTQGSADGTGVDAQFKTPWGMAIDTQGTIYVADYNNDRIRKITPAGVVSTLAGSTRGFADGNGTNAQFNRPTSIAVDSQGNVYVADRNNHKIRKITANGEVSTIAGSTQGFADGTGLSAKFKLPTGVAVDLQNNVYVADYDNHKIRKITPAGEVTTFAGSTEGFADGTGVNTQFDSPRGVVTDAQNNVYVADSGNHRVRKITSSGVVTTLAGGAAGFANGTGINAQFDEPQDITVDVQGNLYVSDKSNYKIRKITPEGVVTTFAGSTEGYADGTGIAAKFAIPIGIGVDNQRNIYVTDIFKNTIRKITQE